MGSVHPKSNRNWGVSAFRAEKYDEAAGPLERQLRRTPNDLTIREMLGLCYYMGDKFAKSAETLRSVLDQLPDNAGLLYAAACRWCEAVTRRMARAFFLGCWQTIRMFLPYT